MASEQDHLTRARANEAFALGISPLTNGDWKIVTTFYAALHYVESVVVRSGQQSTDHRSRASHLRKIAELRLIEADYLTLANYAWTARYDPGIDWSKEPKVQELCDLLGDIKLGLRVK